MSNLHKLLLTMHCGLAAAGASFAQSSAGTAEAAETVVTFKFVPGQDMFYIPWGGNDAELNRLYALVDKYRTEIAAGRMPVYVDGYSGSMRSAERNAELAFIRANRVKSELITQKGLAEDNFVTKNYATAYTGADGIAHKDMVVVTLRIPAKAEQPRRPEPVEEPGREEPAAVVERQPEPVVEQKPEPQAQAQPQVQPQAPAAPAKPYCLAVRTNLLYDAFLLPTLGVEWRVSHDLGIKMDGSLAWWGGPHGKVQKMWMLSPEVRWYLTPARHLYAGVGGNFGEANIYEYPSGSLFTDNTGYQGTFWSAGVTVGYQLPLSRALSLDFNLGLGYFKAEYDSFGVTDGVRVYKARNLSEDMWGPTQAGVSLVWTIGGNKQ